MTTRCLPEIEITPEMVEAGVDAYFLHKQAEEDETLADLRETVRLVVQAALRVGPLAGDHER